MVSPDPLSCSQGASAVNGFDSPYKPVFQADLDPVGMRGGFCQNIPDDAFCEFSGSLVLFQYNGYFQADDNIGSFGSVRHLEIPLFFSCCAAVKGP
jgi:hypothetical protein